MAIGVASVLSLIFFYPRSYTHVFYDRLLRFHRSYTSKQPYQWVSVDHIERITLTPVSKGGESFVVAQVIPESSAVIWRGMNDQFLKLPILCFDAEALCYELLEWRTRIGLKEKTQLPSDETDADEVACSLEVAMEEMLEDPFTQTLNDLAYQLFALALIESLPETHLDKR
jgi:hypothetical protein